MSIMIDFERIFNKTRGFLSIFKLLFKKTLKVPSNYSLVFSDNFKYFDKSKWRYGYIWGILHPNYPYQFWKWCKQKLSDENLNSSHVMEPINVLRLKNLLQQILTYIPGTILPAIFGLLYTSIFTRVFNPSEFGEYTLVFGLISLIASVFYQ